MELNKKVAGKYKGKSLKGARTSIKNYLEEQLNYSYTIFYIQMREDFM